MSVIKTLQDRIPKKAEELGNMIGLLVFVMDIGDDEVRELMALLNQLVLSQVDIRRSLLELISKEVKDETNTTRGKESTDEILRRLQDELNFPK